MTRLQTSASDRITKTISRRPLCCQLNDLMLSRGQSTWISVASSIQPLAVVPPVKSDQIDKVEVVAHRSIAARSLIHCAHRLTCRLVPQPCRAPAGDSHATPPNRSPATIRETAEADACGLTLMGMALQGLAGLGIRSLHYESLRRSRLASQGLSLVLDLENSTWKARATVRAEAK